MPAKRIAIAVLLLAVSSPLLAQATLVVDANQGPGTQFTDIPPAIAAAAPGDVIVVRAGSYTGFTVNKPLSIVASSLGVVSITPPTGGLAFSIDRLPSDTDFAMRGLVVSGFIGGAINDCRGRVLLEGVDTPSLNVSSSDQVMLNRCRMAPIGCAILASSVATSECSAGGFTMFGSTVHLARTDVPAATLPLSGGGGILMGFSTVTVGGDSSTVIAAALFATPAPAIRGDGSLTIDPDVVLAPSAGQPPVAPAISVTVAELPTLAARGAPIGGSLQVELRGEPSDLFTLIGGMPSVPLLIPALSGAMWIAPTTAIVVAAGVLDASARHAQSFLVPNDPAFVGVVVGWIGVAGPAAQSPRFTNNVGHTQSAD